LLGASTPEVAAADGFDVHVGVVFEVVATLALPGGVAGRRLATGGVVEQVVAVG